MQFSLLWWITGNPLAAAALLLLGYAVADWYSFGLLRGLARALRNLRRAPRLARQIAVNPHDRRARVELGEILVEQGRFARAIDVLRPAAQHDPHDLSALYPLGIACLRSGRFEEGELFLRELHGAGPEFRLGRAPLEIGADRLRRGDAKGAVGPLLEYVKGTTCCRALCAARATRRAPRERAGAHGRSTTPRFPTSGASSGAGRGVRDRRARCSTAPPPARPCCCSRR